MTKRAIVLVPGFSKREHLAARNQLVAAIANYTDGYKTQTSDLASQTGLDAINIVVESRQTDYTVELDVYEAFWGDLVPDWSNENPWSRFKRGMLLIFYWATGGLAKSVARQEIPTRTIFALLMAAFFLIIWYLSVVNVLAQAMLNADVFTPAWFQTLTNTKYIAPVITFFDGLGNWPLFLFLIGLLGMGRMEGIANISTFLKAYLRDDPMGEDNIGIRAKARKRVLDVLDQVHSQKNIDQYDEVYVVAHSLGGAIAVDALAEYGAELSKTTLHTWGSMLGLLAQQEMLVELEIAKLYSSPTPMKNWVDVVFRNDWLASPRPEPRVYEKGARTREVHKAQFAETFVPPMPRKSILAGSDTHNAYYRCEEAVIMLVGPEADLPTTTID